MKSTHRQAQQYAPPTSDAELRERERTMLTKKKKSSRDERGNDTLHYDTDSTADCSTPSPGRRRLNTMSSTVAVVEHKKRYDVVETETTVEESRNAPCPDAPLADDDYIPPPPPPFPDRRNFSTRTRTRTSSRLQRSTRPMSPCSLSLSSLDRSVTSSSRSFRPPEAVYVLPPTGSSSANEETPPPSSMSMPRPYGYLQNEFSAQHSCSTQTSSSKSSKLKRLRRKHNYHHHSLSNHRDRSKTLTSHRSCGSGSNIRKRSGNSRVGNQAMTNPTLKLGLRLISLLSYALMMSLIVILYIVHNMSFDVSSSISSTEGNGGSSGGTQTSIVSVGGMHAQVEVADMFEHRPALSVKDVTEGAAQNLRSHGAGVVAGSIIKNLANRFASAGASAVVSPRLLTEDGNGGGNDERPVQDDEAITMVGTVKLTKPISEVTWHDLKFGITTPTAPSCSTRIDPEDVSFTLVTQVSEDRLWMLTEHCRRWSGPISAAVFTDRTVADVLKVITTPGGVEEGNINGNGRETVNAAGDEGGNGKDGEKDGKRGRDKKADDGTEVTAPKKNKSDVGDDHGLYGSCSPSQVHIQTMSKEGIPRGEYPVNTLRNLALRGVHTTHIFYADIDFWESKNLFNALHSKFTRQQFASDPKLALVIPAFQIARQCKEARDCRRANMFNMPHTKKELIKMVMEKRASAFDPTNRGGHGSTSYSDWFRMEEGDLWDIPCITSNRYEPYLAVRYCDELPPYQEVFTGYGKNKMTQIMQMRKSGYVFSQVGGIFVVHYPHLSSKERLTWNKGKKHRDKLLAKKKTTDWTKYKRGRVDKLFVEFRRWLREEVDDKSRVQMCEDAMDDDQKLWVSSKDLKDISDN